MILLALLGLPVCCVFAAGTPQASSDTTLTVVSGSKLEVFNPAGSIVIRTSNRTTVSVSARGARRDPLDIELANGVLHVRPGSARGVALPSIAIDSSGSVNARVEVRTYGAPPPRMDIEIDAPSSMALDISGVDSDVHIDGAARSVHATAVHGELVVSHTTGRVSLESLDGKIRIDNTSGDVSITAPNNDISVTGAHGTLHARSVNGSISVTKSLLSSAELRTYNGVVRYGGSLTSPGPYLFASFDGTVFLTLDAHPSAAVEVTTISGVVKTHGASALRLDAKSRRGMVLFGSGTSHVVIESFHGDIDVTVEEPNHE